MYRNTTEQCRQVIDGSSRTFAASFICGETTYFDIKSLKILVPSALSGKVNIGDTISKSVEIEISNAEILKGSKIEVFESVKLGLEEYEDISMGKFTVTKASTKESVTSVEAAGPLTTETAIGYFSELVYPVTTIQMLNELSDIIGVTIETDGLEEIVVSTKPEGYTCREVIGYIAALHGSNAVETREGTIALKWYEDCEDDIFTDKMDSPELENDLFVIEKFECIHDETSITRGNGFTGISIENPLMTEEIADFVWNKIVGFSYRPGTFSIKSGTPLVDPWDSFIYNNERVIAAELEYIHDGGLQNTYKSVGESKTTSASKGPIAQKLDRYYADLLLVKEAMIDSLTVAEADIRYLKADSISAITLVVKEAAIAELSADFVTVKSVEANYANITLSNVEKSTIGTLFADIGLITDATIVDGHVTGFLDAVEVNANSVTAGTLSVDRLIFRGAEKSIVYELNNITGALQAVQSETLNGEILTDRSITVDKIVAKSITANEIATETITANELAVNSVTADKIVANAITSAKIASGAITADKIATKTITADKINVDDLFAQSINATGSITGATLYGGKLQTSDEYGFVTHYGYYSRYERYGYENYLEVCNAGVDFNSVTKDGMTHYCHACFTKNGEICILIDADKILMCHEDDRYRIASDGTAELNTLKVNALSGSLGAFVVPVSNGGTGTTTAAGARTNLGLGSAATCGATNLTGAGYMPYASTTVPTTQGLVYWNGAYNSSGSSNLAYCNKGAFGTAAICSVATSITSGSSALVPSNLVYVALAGKANSSHSHSYLPLSGGTLTGNLTMSGASEIVSAGDADIRAAQYVFIAAGGATCAQGQEGAYKFTKLSFMPAKDNVSGLGHSSYRWKQLIAGTTTISTSDRNAKDNITPLTDIHKEFFMKLIPVSFTFKDGTSGRTHIGFISQDVEQVMEELGMTSLDFAGFCKDVKTKIEITYEVVLDEGSNVVLDENGKPKQKVIEKEVPDLGENGDIQYIYSLRYDEFIALIAYVLQDTVNKLDVMNVLQQNILSRIVMLEAQIANMAA